MNIINRPIKDKVANTKLTTNIQFETRSLINMVTIMMYTGVAIIDRIPNNAKSAIKARENLSNFFINFLLLIC